MKLAFIIDHYDARKGGGESYVTNLTSRLAELGHEVHLFANTFRGQHPGIRFHKLPTINFPRGLKVISLAFTARWRIWSQGFDVVQGFGGAWNVDVHRPGGGAEMAWLEAELSSIPRGWRRWTKGILLRTSLKTLANLWIESKIYQRDPLPLIIANSRKVKKELMERYPRLRENALRVLFNGVDLIRFHPENRDRWLKEIRGALNIPQGRIVILFVAHNFRLKGLGALLEALTEVDPRGYVLVVAGRGRKERFRPYLERVKIPVIFLGAVEKIESTMAAADLLVHPTFYDCFSNVVAEAMASGLPVITTSRDGASELIKDGVTGFVIREPSDTKLLKEKILALGDAALREKMGIRARAAVEPYSWDWHLQEMEKLYKEVAEIKGRMGSTL